MIQLGLHVLSLLNIYNEVYTSREHVQQQAFLSLSCATLAACDLNFLDSPSDLEATVRSTT